eukprot:COSAG01_NODE_7284_length_3271_cov_65.572194_2_plen_114_part_00
MSIKLKVSRLGHKYMPAAQKAAQMGSMLPGVGSKLGMVNKALGAAQSGLGVVDSANKALSSAGSGIRATQSAVKAGDYHQAANVLRDTAKDSYASGRRLQTSARSVLEKTRRG